MSLRANLRWKLLYLGRSPGTPPRGLPFRTRFFKYARHTSLSGKTRKGRERERVSEGKRQNLRPRERDAGGARAEHTCILEKEEEEVKGG